MPNSSKEILERFRIAHGQDIDLTLRESYRDLLAKLDNPQNRLPPVFHVAGTNGKGSTCAFLRAMLEAGGYKVHVYTSPHLITCHERIRLAGECISENELAALLTDIEKLAPVGSLSYFEALTAAAFAAFTRHAADFAILETGLGGRLDATNIIAKPQATIITRLSMDHREYLGDTVEKIAQEKAGIMRTHVPCFAAEQPMAAASRVLRERASNMHAPLFLGGAEWKIEKLGKGFRFVDDSRRFDLPAPALTGQHQHQNAGLAIAALASLNVPLAEMAIKTGLRTVEWPARLQRLQGGKLSSLLPRGSELWLDGGHNDSAGEVLAAQIENWRKEDGNQPKPLFVVLGMLTTKYPEEFLAPFAKNVIGLRTVPIPHESLSYNPPALALEARKIGLSAESSENVCKALNDIAGRTYSVPPRILICGSLYLAGIVLAEEKG